MGTDQGLCVRVVPGVSYECNWTTFLAGGNIVVESVLRRQGQRARHHRAALGATATLRERWRLHAREGGAKFAFVFHIIG